MSRIAVQASGEDVAFQIEDENGGQAQFRLDRRSATELILRALQELENLPPLEGELFREAERPLLQGRPSFQLGVGDSGDVAVAFRLDPFATVQFMFDDELALRLAREITEITSVPRGMRYQPNKN
jgi:hypothetical protein